MLKMEETKVNSKALQRLAQAIAAYEGPFDKINQVIQKMILRLMTEQKDEDDHKDWCDPERPLTPRPTRRRSWRSCL